MNKLNRTANELDCLSILLTIETALKNYSFANLFQTTYQYLLTTSRYDLRW